MRLVSYEGKTYKYRVGNGYTDIRCPNGKKYLVSNPYLRGVSWDTWDRGQWKRSSDWMIKPGHIKRYIRKHILKAVNLTPA